MGLPEKKPFISPQEYLAHERLALEKSEYFQGEVFAMAGATKEHNRITSNITTAFNNYLRGKNCVPYSSDMRVHIPDNGLFTYPDLVVCCGNEEFLEDEFDTLLNPTVIIEVLSKSTKDYDKGSKFELYRSIPSLKEYITISSLEFHIEKNVKNFDNSWTLTESSNIDDSIFIESLQYNLEMKNIYFNLQWDEKQNHLVPRTF